MDFGPPGFGPLAIAPDRSGLICMPTMADSPAAVAVRRASPADAEQIAAIYNEGIAGRASTFETELQTPADIAGWFGPRRLPVLVAQARAGGIVGWAQIAPYSSRPCYAGVGEASVYVTERSRGRGIGTALAAGLAREADRAGFYKLLGKLFPENAASRRLVARLGFREVGLHLRHGRLNGEWRDVLLVELLLGEAQPALPGEVAQSEGRPDGVRSRSSTAGSSYSAGEAP
jgi:L-amino acid N-acyltransferase YncA